MWKKCLETGNEVLKGNWKHMRTPVFVVTGSVSLKSDEVMEEEESGVSTTFLINLKNVGL